MGKTLYLSMFATPQPTPHERRKAKRRRLASRLALIAGISLALCIAVESFFRSWY